MLQFTQSLGFDLTNTLSGNIELLADLFQRTCPAVIETETKTQYLSSRSVRPLRTLLISSFSS